MWITLDYNLLYLERVSFMSHTRTQGQIIFLPALLNLLKNLPLLPFSHYSTLTSLWSPDGSRFKRGHCVTASRHNCSLKPNDLFKLIDWGNGLDCPVKQISFSQSRLVLVCSAWLDVVALRINSLWLILLSFSLSPLTCGRITSRCSISTLRCFVIILSCGWTQNWAD